MDWCPQVVRFPVLVPGQNINKEIIDFLRALDVKEIHGYRAEVGLRVFTEAALGRHRTGTTMGGGIRTAISAPVAVAPTPAKKKPAAPAKKQAPVAKKKSSTARGKKR